MNELSKVLFQEMRSKGALDNPSSLQLGEVISINPLIIKIGELQLDKDNLLIAEHLLTHKRKFRYNTNDEFKEFEFKSVLDVGSTVVCYPILKGQKYLVLEKVV